MLLKLGRLQKGLMPGVLLIFGILSGCKKFVTVDAPPTNLSSGNVYKSDGTATSVITNLYAQMSVSAYGDELAGSNTNLAGSFLFAGLSADELTLFNPTNTDLNFYYTNGVNANMDAIGCWDEVYGNIFTVNSAIEGLSSGTGMTPSVQQQLLGEAYFLRGFYYFYLVNFYGRIPLITGVDAHVNGLAAASSVDSAYGQIISDLRIAEALLSNNYLSGNLLTTTTEKVRPTKWAAAALLARAFLYHKDYDSAYAQSSLVINSNSYQLDSLNQVFLKNSNEAIWQLQSITLGQQANTAEGQILLLPSAGPDINNYQVYLSNSVVNSFEPGDMRKLDWIDSVVVGPNVYYYAYKYKSGALQMNTTTEYEMVLRLGEQYLIRAEAQANGAGGGLAAAVADLNTIRQRAGLPNYNGAASLDAVMSALLHERQVELFTEWGHRWFDLKRWPGNAIGNVMSVAAPVKGGVWNADNHQALYPLQQGELNTDPNLVQNPGY